MTEPFWYRAVATGSEAAKAVAIFFNDAIDVYCSLEKQQFCVAQPCFLFRRRGLRYYMYERHNLPSYFKSSLG